MLYCVHKNIIFDPDPSILIFQLILNDFGHIITLADICGNDRVSLAKALLNLFRHERQVKILLKNINDYGIAKEGISAVT